MSDGKVESWLSESSRCIKLIIRDMDEGTVLNWLKFRVNVLMERFATQRGRSERPLVLAMKVLSPTTLHIESSIEAMLLPLMARYVNVPKEVRSGSLLIQFWLMSKYCIFSGVVVSASGSDVSWFPLMSTLMILYMEGGTELNWLPCISR